LAESFAQVEGCDNSAAMIILARDKHPKLRLFEWDGLTPIPPHHGPYDVIVSKLVVPFIHNLRSHAVHLRTALRSSGSLVISAVHPVHSAKQVENYWHSADYKVQIGRFGIYDVAVHRSIETIINEFINGGFVLTGLSEPETPATLAKSHLARPDEFKLPKRINLRFQADQGTPH
jgi:hypothetical protein